MWINEPPKEPNKYYWFKDKNNCIDICYINYMFKERCKKLIYIFFNDEDKYTEEELNEDYKWWDEPLKEPPVNCQINHD